MESESNAAPGLLEVADARTAYRLSWVANFMSGPLYRQLELSWGLSRPEFIVLANCRHRPGSTAQDICLATGRPKNSISRAVLKLARDGRLLQEADRADARQKRLRLTPEGERLYAEIIPLFERREAEMLSVLDPAERETLDALLAKLVRRTDGWARLF